MFLLRDYTSFDDKKWDGCISCTGIRPVVFAGAEVTTLCGSNHCLLCSSEKTLSQYRSLIVAPNQRRG